MKAPKSNAGAKPRAIAHGSRGSGANPRATLAATVFGWALSLLVVAGAAKVSLVVLHAVDDTSVTWINPWFAIAFLTEDLRLVAAFAAVVAALTWLGRMRPAGRRLTAIAIAIATVHAVLGFWMALNIPVARFFSTPLTYSFLHATGSALGDSIAGYASLPNVGIPIVVWAVGLAFARWVRPRLHPSPRLMVVVALAALFVLALGPMAVRRVDTLGLHRNAVIALGETTLARWFSRRNDARPPLSSPACAPLRSTGTEPARPHNRMPRCQAAVRASKAPRKVP
ncbi:MAG TPA: hypothetical protein VI565_08855 [Burkholderiales bacterium]|nr:hypothetical protein [Burkholderiales bacterium]